jgi:hypothetical protein
MVAIGPKHHKTPVGADHAAVVAFTDFANTNSYPGRYSMAISFNNSFSDFPL